MEELWSGTEYWGNQGQWNPKFQAAVRYSGFQTLGRSRDIVRFHNLGFAQSFRLVFSQVYHSNMLKSEIWLISYHAIIMFSTSKLYMLL